jgi:hypothetical protein
MMTLGREKSEGETMMIVVVRPIVVVKGGKEEGGTFSVYRHHFSSLLRHIVDDVGERGRQGGQ